MQKEIKQTFFYSHKPEVVWEYLTKSELIEQWLGKTDFKPIVGHKFRFVSPYGNDSICEVLEVKPFAKLSYSWQKNSAIGGKPFNSKIEWTLVPKENGTELQLLHTGFITNEDVIAHESGWNICIKQFEELINTGKIKGKSFTATIEVSKSPQSVFKSITKDVAKWWGGKDFKGDSAKLNDEFIINHPGAHYSKQKLVEVIPDKKVVWLVTDSTLNWLKQDQHEWANTKMIFEITTKGDKTVLHFTHEGLLPEKECYHKCEQGWSMVIKDWLFNYITNDKPHFNL